MSEQKNTDRSEKLRTKRESRRKRKPARKSRTTQNASQNMPPVLMRGGFNNMAWPKQKRKSKTPKRRFDIALSSPGVEISLPAVPAIRLGWRLLSALLSISLLLFFYYLWTTPIYQVQAAELEGNHYLNNEAINQVLNLYNKPIFMIDPQQMEADLQRAFPGLMVDSAVQVILPATVIVTIQERQPIIAWEQDGETAWVDAVGISFDPVGENDTLIKVSAAASPQAPITINNAQDESDEEIDPLEEILTPEAIMTLQMVTAIQTMKDYAPNKAFLTYDPQHGLGWHDTKRDWDVYFGLDMSNIEEKLAVFKAIKLQVKEDGISPALISIEHVHAPYYRLEP